LPTPSAVVSLIFAYKLERSDINSSSVTANLVRPAVQFIVGLVNPLVAPLVAYANGVIATTTGTTASGLQALVDDLQDAAAGITNPVDTALANLL
jgi:hypothetical protein